MATTASSKVASTVPEREPHSGVFALKATFAHPTSGDGSAAGDIIQMVKVAKGTMILDMALSAEDLDTGTTIEFDVGDGDDVDRFIDGTTIGQAGGIVRLGSGVAAAAIDGAHGYVYPADDTIDVKVVAAATGKTAGTITLTVLCTMED